MIDHTDLVERMRDIHYPPFKQDLYILLFAGTGIACAISITMAIIYYSKGRVSSISGALQSLDAARPLPSDERIVAYAHIIRTLVASLDGKDLSLTGEEWLNKLDRTFKTDFFSSGNGRIFGDNLYRREEYILPNQLDDDLKILIQELGDR
jgi:hypothetical protein